LAEDADEKTPVPRARKVTTLGHGRSAEVDRELSPITLLRRLDKIQWDLDILLAAHQSHKEDKRDERFVLMEHDFKVMKRLAWICVGAALIAVVSVVANGMISRVASAVTQGSSADRITIDRAPPHWDAGPK
jgi:hypothetical protein